MQWPNVVPACTCLASLIFVLSCANQHTPPQPLPSADFTFSVSPISLTVAVGATSPPSVFLVKANNGFNASVLVDITGLPDGVSSAPSFPLTLTAGNAQDVTFSIPPSFQTRSILLQFSASGGGLPKTGSMTINVNPQPIIESYQQGTMLFLQSITGAETVQVGLDTSRGASITEFIFNSVNYVNTNDPGREVQAGLWDGDHADESKPGFWGTVQAGDHDFNGSPVLAQTLDTALIYTKTQPLHWIPEYFGGGAGNPRPSDIFIEQWLTPVVGHGRAFKVHYEITHFGNDTHTNAGQECPAVYVNRGFDTFQYYGGPDPWTYDSIGTYIMPDLPKLSDLLYTPEHWGAYVDSNNSGITVYTPGSYPYSVGFDNPGPSPNGTNDFSPSTTFTWYPGAVLEFDFYLIAGPVEDARPIVYELQKAQTATPFAPWGNLEAPLSGDTVSGTSGVVGGWVFALTPVKTVEILVDGSSAGVASYGSSRPDVASAFPGQSSNTGFQFALDTTKFANGTHSVNARITDAAGNIAILPTAQVTIVNP
jgi:hypothetical protein